MDPNKDFIHIDELFKNLRNGEEREQSGAWLNMKNLLDAEMPVGGAVSGGGRAARRYIIPALALLLLGGGGVTYWKMNGDKKAGLAATEITQPATTSPAGGQELHTGNSGTDKGAGSEAITTTTLPAAGKSGSAGHAGATSTQATPGTAAGSRHTETGSRSIAGNSSAASSGSAAAATHKATSGTPGNTAAAKGSRPARHATASPAQQQPANTGGAHNDPATTLASAAGNAGKAANNAAKPTVLRHQQVVETIKPKESAAIALAANTEAATPAGNSDNTKQVWKTKAVVNNKKIVESPDGHYYKEERDTFKRIDIVEHYTYPHNNANKYSLPRLVTDTVAITRIENIRYVPLTRMDAAELKKLNVNIAVKEMVPLAKLKAGTVSKEHVSMVPLSNYKVASRRVDPSSFNKLIQNTAGGLAGYFDGSRNFYAAIMVGGNTNLGSPGAFGMQLGIAGLLALSERWTLAAELRYVNHYFSNYSLQDQSVSYDISKTQNGSGWLFSGNELTTSSVYKINSYGSIHMPVTMNYNLGRVSIFGGIDLAYAFPLSWEKRTNTNTIFVESQQQQDRNPYQDKTFLFDEKNDFSSRFGLGYALGMSYDFSRKLSIDARLTQTLFDNARGNTEAINKLFRQPSLQLSLGYYFGRKDKVVYIMDKR